MHPWRSTASWQTNYAMRSPRWLLGTVRPIAFRRQLGCISTTQQTFTDGTMCLTVAILLIAAVIADSAYAENQIDFGTALVLDQQPSQSAANPELDPMPKEPKPLFPIARVSPKLLRVVQHQAPAAETGSLPIDFSVACELEEESGLECEAIPAPPIETTQPVCVRPPLQPAIMRVDPIYPTSFIGMFGTPDCCRGFWATYPMERARCCQEMQQSQICREECPTLYLPVTSNCNDCEAE